MVVPDTFAERMGLNVRQAEANGTPVTMETRREDAGCNSTEDPGPPYARSTWMAGVVADPAGDLAYLFALK